MASFKINANYRVSGDKSEIDGVDLISSATSTYGEPSKLNRIAHPIQIPSSGSSFSYEKWLSFECVDAPEVPINELKIWSDGSQPATGATWYGRIQDSFEEPALITSVTSISGTGTISISGSNIITGSGTVFETELDDGQLIRVSGVDHLFQPKSIDSDTQITLFNTYNSSVSGSAFMIEPYARMDTWIDGSDDWHTLSISGVFSETGDERGYLVLVEEIGTSASAGECPSTENSSILYYNWEITTDVYGPQYIAIDNFDPGFGHRSSISGTDEFVIGNNDSLTEGAGDQFYGENFYNFNSYQGTIYGYGKSDWNGDDQATHYLMDIQNSSYRLSFKKTTIDNQLQFSITDGTITSSASVSDVTLTQGTRYWYFARWDTSNTIDGTNYLTVTVNNSSAGSPTVPPVINLPANINWFHDVDGEHTWSGAMFLGIDECAWSNSEIGAFYNAGKGKGFSSTSDLKGVIIGELSGNNVKLAQFPQGEGSGYKNLITCGHQDGTPIWATDTNVSTASSSTRKSGRKSREITWAAGASAGAKAYMTATLEEAQDYMYDVWVKVNSLSDDMYFKISPHSLFIGINVARQLNTGTDDEGTAYATGTWLHYMGVFRSSDAGTHYVGFVKPGTNGGAVVCVDQLKIHKMDFNSPHPLLMNNINDYPNNYGINFEDSF